MGELAEVLEEYAQTISDLGFDVYSTVRPGLEPVDIIAKLGAAGVEPTDDLIDWFAYSNGLLPAVPGEPRLSGVFDDVDVVSLAEALQEREERLDPNFLANRGLDEQQIRELADADLVVPYEASWMPISRGKQTCVIETNRSSTQFGVLMALWTDELMPRTKAPTMLNWVRSLSEAARVGAINLYVPSDSWQIARAFYDLGAVQLSERNARFLQISVSPERLAGRCSRLRLRHAPLNSLAGNDGLEEIQARNLEGVLREIGLDACDYEFEAASPPIDHRHMIEILGVR